MIFEIVKQTGWSWDQVLWSVSRANLLLMVADESRYRMKKAEDEPAIPDSGKNLAQRFKARRAN